MSAMTQPGPATATELASTSSEQFQGWVQSPEGLRLWNELRIPLSPERLCHVLAQVRVERYGLLISPDGTVILSAIHQESFARLEARYRAAAAGGLCFWWEGGTLTFIEECELFFKKVRTLPPLSDRVWHLPWRPGQSASYRRACAHLHRNLPSFLTHPVGEEAIRSSRH